MQIHQKLKFWFQKEGRDLPWRQTNDPYFIWLSEVILQQTRVEQGLPYYVKFIERFPRISDLAHASEDEVFRLWQGLGYYSRAKSLLKTARLVESTLQGVFPNSYSELIALPGIGPYTGAAIASFSFNLPHPVLDGNVKRVVSRCLQLEEPVESKRAATAMQSWLNQSMDPTDPATFNQAIMELGALVCLPRNPACTSCPIQEHCLSGQTGNPEHFPVKAPKPAKQVINFAFAHAQNNNSLVIQKRQADGIWGNLWELPSISTLNPAEISDLEPYFPGASTLPYAVVELKPHLLSHREIRGRVFVFRYTGALIPGQKWIQESELDDYGFPRILTRYFETNKA